MGLFSDGMKSFLKAATSSGAEEERFRVGIEKAGQQLVVGMEYKSEPDLRKGLKILDSLNDGAVIDDLLLYSKYKLKTEISIRLTEVVIKLFKSDTEKAARGIVNPDELKTVEQLKVELAQTITKLESEQENLEHLMRQPFSHKNDEDVSISKKEVQRLNSRKKGLEEATLMTRSRGAEHGVMEDTLIQKVNEYFKEAFNSLVRMNELNNLPPKVAEDKLNSIMEGKRMIDELKAEVKVLLQ